ncbi:hypothetical protein DPEC_G00186060 [Dallia pectoralis]|uniref:Uncharacterized protein n=1 Tax=Dallia pectoralis TaxID=75939 RepID=A0ACC2GBF0_DALPE|nr:hypothetical protein DPEC_G00186060 [Dallia pectoralis]
MRQDFLRDYDYFMAVALLAAKRSKDPNTQVGACIVNQENKIVGIGNNNMPNGCDDKLPWSRDAKDNLQASSSRSRQDLVYEVLITLGRVVSKGCQVRFSWVPAHVGVVGNEAVDRVAKKALREEVVTLGVKWSKGEAKSMIWAKMMERWQVQWDEELKGRHLYRI